MADSRRWSEIREVGFISGMRLLFWIYRHGGSVAFKFVLQPVLLYYFLTNRVARHASMDYLQRLYRSGSGGGLPQPSWWNVYRHISAFARNALDRLGVWANAPGLREVHFPNRPVLLDQLATGKGAVLLGAHLGNMEICRNLSTRNPDLKLNILVHTRNADMFNRLLSEVVGESNVELIEVSELSPATAIRLHECIERGEFVAILADRVPVASGGRSIGVEFLGARAPFPVGPFILASLLKCPVYTLFCTRSAGGYTIGCQPFAERIRLPRGKREQQLEKYMQDFARILEDNVRSAPLQWFNFYPFWDQL